MNYAAIKERDIANGVGVRVSLFVSGCTHHCKNCFNREAWSFEYGEPYTAEIEQKLLDLLAPSYVNGLSLLGGEPMEPQNQQVLKNLVQTVKKLYPAKDIWCYSGYTFETELLSGRAHTDVTDAMLGCIDVLVDGEFVEEQKNISLKFRGSENQRIIDVHESLRQGKTVLKEV